jgi:hypothetical protein
MFKKSTSAGTAAQKSSKCSVLARCALILAIPMLCAVFSCQAQSKFKSVPCKIDTIKGILYSSWYSGQENVDTGYFIAPCGGIQIAALPYFDGMKSVKYPTWIPGRYLRNDNADKKGNQIYGQDWQWQFSGGKFTDKHFKKVNITSVYGLLVVSK